MGRRRREPPMLRKQVDFVVTFNSEERLQTTKAVEHSSRLLLEDPITALTLLGMSKTGRYSTSRYYQPGRCWQLLL
jgi:hypothetical protein